MKTNEYIAPSVIVLAVNMEGRVALTASSEHNTFTNSYAGEFEENIWE